MLKRSKLIYIVGSVAIGVVCVLVVLFGLIAGGAVSGGGAKLIFASESAEKVYDGKLCEAVYRYCTVQFPEVVFEYAVCSNLFLYPDNILCFGNFLLSVQTPV